MDIVSIIQTSAGGAAIRIALLSDGNVSSKPHRVMLSATLALHTNVNVPPLLFPFPGVKERYDLHDGHSIGRQCPLGRIVGFVHVYLVIT